MPSAKKKPAPIKESVPVVSSLPQTWEPMKIGYFDHTFAEDLIKASLSVLERPFTIGYVEQLRKK